MSDVVVFRHDGEYPTKVSRGYAVSLDGTSFVFELSGQKHGKLRAYYPLLTESEVKSMWASMESGGTFEVTDGNDSFLVAWGPASEQVFTPHIGQYPIGGGLIDELRVWKAECTYVVVE